MRDWWMWGGFYVWQEIEYLFNSPKHTQTHRSDHWHEHGKVFIYPSIFFLISKLVEIMERADGDRYI